MMTILDAGVLRFLHFGEEKAAARPMKRPRWHDFIIVFSILALAGAGIGAIWGEQILQAIDGVLESDDGAPEPKPTPPSPAGTHKDLL